MADVVSPAKRSQMMAGIKGKHTKPELIVRRELHRRGFRFRLHRRDLPGSPDIVLPKFKTVIFVNGCFWHGHDCKYFKLPKSNQEFWKRKISSNKERDRKKNLEIVKFGWKPLTVWECATRMDPNAFKDTMDAVELEILRKL